MKNASEYGQRLATLLQELKQAVKDLPEPPSLPSPNDHLVYAFLLWETTRRQAEQAYPRLMKRIVDFNDLRITDPRDVASALGSRYSRAEERAMLLHQVLQALYEREHTVDLESLNKRNKRDARTFLDSLNGMVPFVSASVMLLGMGAHAIPVDEQLMSRLKKDKVVDPEASLEETQAFLEHQIKAAEGLESYLLLREYVEQASQLGDLIDDGDGSATTSQSSPSSSKTSRTSKRSGSSGRSNSRKTNPDSSGESTPA